MVVYIQKLFDGRATSVSCSRSWFWQFSSTFSVVFVDALRSPEELGRMWENFVVVERIKRNDYAGRTFVKYYFWRTQQKKEVDFIEIEDGVMTGYGIKRKEGKRVGAPASFTAAYPDAHIECITPADLRGSWAVIIATALRLLINETATRMIRVAVSFQHNFVHKSVCKCVCWWSNWLIISILCRCGCGLMPARVYNKI